MGLNGLEAQQAVVSQDTTSEMKLIKEIPSLA